LDNNKYPLPRSRIINHSPISKELPGKGYWGKLQPLYRKTGNPKSYPGPLATSKKEFKPGVIRTFRKGGLLCGENLPNGEKEPPKFQFKKGGGEI